MRTTESGSSSTCDFDSAEATEDPYDPYITVYGEPPILTIVYSIVSGFSAQEAEPARVLTTSLLGGGEQTMSEQIRGSFGTKISRNDAGGTAIRNTTVEDPNSKYNAVVHAGTHGNISDDGKMVVNKTPGTLDVTIEGNKITNKKVGSFSVTEKKTKRGATIINNLIAFIAFLIGMRILFFSIWF